MLNKPGQSVQVYPRGFLGKPMDRSTEPPVLAARSPNLLFGFSLVGGTDHATKGSPEVDRLEREIAIDPTYARGFDCFTDLCKIVLTVFATNKFGQWLFVQKQSPAYSELHERFLIDTCNYLLTGKRIMSVYNWEGMFKFTYAKGAQMYGARHTETNTPLRLSESNPLEAAQLFKQFENVTLSTLVLQWLSKEGGFDDLVTTLHILFGSKA